MNKLINLFDVDSEFARGLDGLEVESLEYFEADSKIVLVLSGIDSLAERNNLAGVIRHASEQFEVSFDIKFVDVNFTNVAHSVNALSSYIVSCIKSKNAFADSFSYALDRQALIVKADEGISVIVDDAEINSTGLEFAKKWSFITGIDYPQIKIEKASQIETVDYAIPQEAPVNPVDDDIYNQLYIPDIPSELLTPTEAKAEDKPKEAKPEPKDGTWLGKAKAQQDMFKQSGKSGTSFYKVKNEDALFGKVKSGVDTITCNQLSMNDRLVNVAGSIMIIDELKLTKTGRSVIANFYIIDKTGGISAFMFVDPKEADEFEAKFKKGGYAGFQGEPTNNRGELGLKVTGIFDAPKPPKRTDNAPKKRVELHVHSKMSEKDAVSDPSAIMKMAASFGHQACAITDHGVVQGFPEAYNTAKGLTYGPDNLPFKSILGCEGYLVEDGPTVFYNLPYNVEEMMSVGSVVALTIKTTGDDSCTDKIISVAASKYRIKGYMPVEPDPEGESDESAIEFSSKDIDKSLWEEEELPDFLRDEVINAPDPEPEPFKSHIINQYSDVKTVYSSDKNEVIPDELIWEHVADFYATIDDVIYQGTGEPSDSYHRMGELLDFIGASYVTGPDIFKTLAFLRRAGYGINIEDHVYYRHKFLMPAISIEDIQKYVYGDYYKKSLEDTVRGLECPYIREFKECDDEDCNSMLHSCYDAANLVIYYLQDKESINPYELNSKVGHYQIEDIKSKNNMPYHIILLARNNLGLYNMYRLVSEGHVHYYHSRPRMPKSLIKYYSSSLIIGGACERGEIFRELLAVYKSCGKNVEATKAQITTSDKFETIVGLYDYIEIQPLCNNMFMTRETNTKNDPAFVPVDADDIRIINELLLFIADFFNKPCVATTDSHFLDIEDGMYRKNLMIDLGFADAELQSDLYFRTTDEMLEEFDYLGKDRAYEVVVENTNKIADMIERGIKPFPDGTYPPIIKRAAADVRDISYTRANRMYRHNGVLNEVVKARLEKELKSIIGNGFAIMYYIAYRLVKKSNNDGYIVGSRGSVGSSFVATMCGISEVNPLAPHYRCPKCNYLEFNNTGEFGSGFDMPLKSCPECGETMVRDGQDIPFETFLGFFGDKQPDIDLNFASDYQPRAHKYVEVLFGTNHTFRAGTIGTYADKNALAVARKVGEKRQVTYTNAMQYYMTKGIVGVKRTTSQHPGGIVVIAKEMDVYEFTPIQYPANKTDCGIITTHFDFHAMHDTILKLDILGHADPNVLRMLQELTGVEVTTIPVPEPKVMSLLETTDALGFPMEATEAGAATLGLSEMGTHMARGMIKEAKPRRFFDLVQLMGLSHGTDVWSGNAQDLIRAGICDLNSVIGCRDSIMTRLIYWGLPEKDSFDIMEKVRKGKGLSEAHESLMRENNVPDWYIESCKKIKYMFPKAHAAAYSISSLRVAWFKVYYPEEYYCAFFTIRGVEFAAETMCQGEEVLRNRRLFLNDMMHQDNNPKIKSEYYLCEIVEEMYHRGIEFLPIDLKTSDAIRFKKVAKGKILPPLNIIENISDGIAEGIVKARDEAPFANREDLMQRSGIGKSALQALVDYGLCADLPESAQMDIFDLLGGG